MVTEEEKALWRVASSDCYIISDQMRRCQVWIWERYPTALEGGYLDTKKKHTLSAHNSIRQTLARSLLRRPRG
jgi:hypothetical protein